MHPSSAHSWTPPIGHAHNHLQALARGATALPGTLLWLPAHCSLVILGSCDRLLHRMCGAMILKQGLEASWRQGMVECLCTLPDVLSEGTVLAALSKTTKCNGITAFMDENKETTVLKRVSYGRVLSSVSPDFIFFLLGKWRWQKKHFLFPLFCLFFSRPSYLFFTEDAP